MKDHEIAQVINQVRDVAIEFHGTQQLRERIAGVLRPILTDNIQTHSSSGFKLVTLDEVAKRASLFAKRLKAGMESTND